MNFLTFSLARDLLKWKRTVEVQRDFLVGSIWKDRHVSPACDGFLESLPLKFSMLPSYLLIWSYTLLPTLVKKMSIPTSSPPKKTGPFSFFSNLAKKSNPQFFGFPPHLRPVTLIFPPFSRVAGRTSSQDTPNGRSRESVKWRATQQKSWKPDVKLEALLILERKRSKLV